MRALEKDVAYLSLVGHGFMMVNLIPSSDMDPYERYIIHSCYRVCVGHAPYIILDPGCKLTPKVVSHNLHGKGRIHDKEASQ